MHRIFVPVLFVLGTMAIAPFVWSAPLGQATQRRVARRTAVVRDVCGKAMQLKDDADPGKDLNAGDILTEQTTVRTGDNAAVLLQLAGGHMFRVGENTKVVLKELGKDKAFSFQVLTGSIWSAVRKLNQPTKYEVETPSAVAGVSGTGFAVFHDSARGQTTVSTTVGAVSVQQLIAPSLPNGASMLVGAGQFIQTGRAAPIGKNKMSKMAIVQVKTQSPALRQMWRIMRTSEGWILPQNASAPYKLNLNVGPLLRKMNFRSGTAIPIKRAPAAPPSGPGVKRR